MKQTPFELKIMAGMRTLIRMTGFRVGCWEVRLASSSHPREALLELTMECNMDCLYCFRRGCPELFGRMDERTFRRVLWELRRAGVRRIVFTGWGEPLTHPKALEFLEEAKEGGFNVVLNTNGTLLESCAEEVVKAGVDEVVVSLDSADEGVYSELHPGNSVSEILRGLRSLREALVNLGRRVVVGFHTTLTTLNCRQAPAILRTAFRFGAAYVRFSNVVPLNREMEGLACYMDEDCRKAMESFFKSLGMLLETPVRVYMPNLTLKAQRTCPFTRRDGLFVGWDGGVSPCLHYGHSYTTHLYGVGRRIDRVTFGNLTEESLTELWRSRPYQAFRFRAEVGCLPSCLDCDMAEYCTFTEDNTMDCWGNTPTCSHCPFIYGLTACPL